MNIKPLGDRLVVKPSTPEETTASGIIIPETAKEKPNKGTVMAVGENLTVVVGDEIMYPKNAGTDIKVDGQEYLIMREPDVYAVI